LLQDLGWHDSRVTGLSLCIIGERSFVVAIGMAVDESTCSVCSIHFPLYSIHFIRSNALFDGLSTQRRSDSCELSVWWHQIVSYIFDEESLALFSISRCPVRVICIFKCQEYCTKGYSERQYRLG